MTYQIGISGAHRINIADLDPLRNFPQLTHLTLLENPVTRKEVCAVGATDLQVKEKANACWSSITDHG